MIKQITSGHFQPTLRVDGTDNYASDGVVFCPVDSATVIEIFDLVYLDTDDAKPASDQSDGGSEAVNQASFHNTFLGNTDPIPVATKGLFECDCPSATFEVGALIGPSENEAGNALLNQQVEGVAAVHLAIGRAARRVNPAGTRVLIEIVSSVMAGGPGKLITRGSALTAQLTTITHTAPGSDDFAIQNLTQTTPFGFVTADEGNTVLKVIANLQARLAEVESRLETLGIIAAN
jgi:hypothetical protein